jgi:hypothetical protein
MSQAPAAGVAARALDRGLAWLFPCWVEELGFRKRPLRTLIADGTLLPEPDQGQACSVDRRTGQADGARPAESRRPVTPGPVRNDRF